MGFADPVANGCLDSVVRDKDGQLAIRVRLQIAEQVRDLAMFNMAVDSKLRACDLVRLAGPIVLPATVTV